jgi:hypothetical protein
MKTTNKLPGGRGDKLKPSDVAIEQIRKGMRVEREHTPDQEIALEIVLDHLAEDPKYYDKLERIDPHDAESEVVSPQIRRREPDDRTFVEGDELYAEVGAVAALLLERGANRLGGEALNWLQEALASTRRKGN